MGQWTDSTLHSWSMRGYERRMNEQKKTFKAARRVKNTSLQRSNKKRLRTVHEVKKKKVQKTITYLKH